jgi:hypothetical protein
VIRMIYETLAQLKVVCMLLKIRSVVGKVNEKRSTGAVDTEDLLYFRSKAYRRQDQADKES